jgi:hypothetical protein
MRIDDLLGKALDALTGKDQNEQGRNVQPSSQDPWGDPADQGVQNQNMGQYPGGVLPASQDPYGDPADQGHNQAGFGNVAPASQDPYGDPADSYNGQQVFDSSQDPYGDPADEEEQAASQPRRSWPF